MGYLLHKFFGYNGKPLITALFPGHDGASKSDVLCICLVKCVKLTNHDRIHIFDANKYTKVIQPVGRMSRHRLVLREKES